MGQAASTEEKEEHERKALYCNMVALTPAPSLQEKKLRHRMEVVREIAATEHSYVDCLRLCMDVFMIPLEKAVEQGKPIIREEQIKAIFSIIKLLHQIHEPFATELQQLVDNYNDKKPFAHVFVNSSGLFRVYTDYVNNYNTSLATLSELCESNRHFSSFLAAAYQNPVRECKGRDLPTFLITPIQRLPRYVLLLQELLKATPTSHKDHKHVVEALSRIKHTTDFINKEKRYAENFQKLIEIQSAFGNEVMLTKSSQRELIKEGDYIAKKKGSRKGWADLHYFLFNDLLVFARPRVGIKSALFASGGTWSLVEYAYLPDTDLKDHADTKEDKNVVGIVMADKKEYLVKFPSAAEKDECISQFYTIRSKAHRVPFADITVKKEKKGKGKGKKVESSKVNEEPTPQLPLKKSVLGGWGSGSKKIDTRTDSKQKGKSSRQDSEIKTPPKQQHQSDKAKEKEALIKQAQNAQPRRLLFCCF